jgi:GntR family transcriptional regulator, galactonate operon transcriptional repressor
MAKSPISGQAGRSGQSVPVATPTRRLDRATVARPGPNGGEGNASRSTLLSRPARLGQIIVSSLIEQIVSGELSTGSPLPPEPVLGQEFNVSRSVIRESVKLLEEKGLVAVRQGQGTTVLPPENWNLLDPPVLDAFIRGDASLSVFDDLIEIRTALESQMARRAAHKLTKAECEELRSHLQGLEALLDNPDGYAKADLLYHDAIGRLSGHVLARSILRTVQPVALANTYYGRTHRTREDNLRSHRGHVAIYEQLVKRDAEGAARAVEAHILGSWATYKRLRQRGSKGGPARAR